MRNLILAFVFLGIAVYIGSTLYERGVAFEWFSIGEKEYVFPDKATLTKENGDALSVLMTARNENYIQFTRISDNRVFVYPILNLSEESIELVRKYPLTLIKDAGRFLEDGSMDLDEIYVEQLREHLITIESDIETLRNMRAQSTSVVEIRSYNNKLEQLISEKEDLTIKIGERIRLSN